MSAKALSCPPFPFMETQSTLGEEREAQLRSLYRQMEDVRKVMSAELRAHISKMDKIEREISLYITWREQAKKRAAHEKSLASRLLTENGLSQKGLPLSQGKGTTKKSPSRGLPRVEDLTPADLRALLARLQNISVSAR